MPYGSKIIPTRIADPRFLRMAVELVEAYDRIIHDDEAYAMMARMSLFLHGDDDPDIIS